MKFSNSREAAEFYLSIGLRPVPLYGVSPEGCACQSPECKPRDWGKHEPPATDGLWKDGREFSADDFAQGSNVALAMGPWGGSDGWLVALDWDATDLDAAAGHIELLALPPTLRQTTPRGLHYIYSVPAFSPLGNWVDCWQSKEQGYQMDLRYARGRIVVAPSKNAAGDYEWESVREPAELPRSVIDLILERRRDRGLPVLEVWERGGKRP